MESGFEEFDVEEKETGPIVNGGVKTGHGAARICTSMAG